MLLCSPIYWNMISSHYSNGDPSPPTANQSLLRLKLFCLKRKNPEVSPVNCKKSWSSNETTTTIQRDPPKPPKHIKQSECHIRNSMAPPKKIQVFFCPALAAIFWGATSNCDVLMARGAQGQQFPLSDLLGGQPGRLIDVKPGEMLSGALNIGWKALVTEIWWVKFGQYWLVMVSNG